MADVVLNFCPNTECCEQALMAPDTNFCWACGRETLPNPQCACGKNVSLRLAMSRLKRGRATFCEGCGNAQTEAALGNLLSEGLKQQLHLVREALDGRN